MLFFFKFKLLIYDGTAEWNAILGNYTFEKYTSTYKTQFLIESTISNTVYILLLRYILVAKMKQVIITLLRVTRVTLLGFQTYNSVTPWANLS